MEEEEERACLAGRIPHQTGPFLLKRGCGGFAAEKSGMALLMPLADELL